MRINFAPVVANLWLQAEAITVQERTGKNSPAIPVEKQGYGVYLRNDKNRNDSVQLGTIVPNKTNTALYHRQNFGPWYRSFRAQVNEPINSIACRILEQYKIMLANAKDGLLDVSTPSEREARKQYTGTVQNVPDIPVINAGMVQPTAQLVQNQNAPDYFVPNQAVNKKDKLAQWLTDNHGTTFAVEYPAKGTVRINHNSRPIFDVINKGNDCWFVQRYFSGHKGQFKTDHKETKQVQTVVKRTLDRFKGITNVKYLPVDQSESGPVIDRTGQNAIPVIEQQEQLNENQLKLQRRFETENPDHKVKWISKNQLRISNADFHLAMLNWNANGKNWKAELMFRKKKDSSFRAIEHASLIGCMDSVLDAFGKIKPNKLVPKQGAMILETKALHSRTESVPTAQDNGIDPAVQARLNQQDSKLDSIQEALKQLLIQGNANQKLEDSGAV